MIPKIIHYCWFGGGKKSVLVKRCVAGWKKLCPDYRIIEWNEDNFDVTANPYVNYCADNKKWAFLSDYARLVIVSKHGGIYLDTDVELIKSPDSLLGYEAFFGFEDDGHVNTGHGFGADAGNPVVAAMMKPYLDMKPDEKGCFNLTACPSINTRALLPLGLKPDGTRQTVAGAEIFPIIYFNPYDNATGVLTKSADTYSIHWYSKSWMSRQTVFVSALARPFHRIFGKDCFQKWKKTGR